MPAVSFFYEGVDFRLPKSRSAKTWIKNVIRIEKREPGELNYIFCSDAFLAQINLEFLGHNSYTDIITFESLDDSRLLEGEIYISIDRVHHNSKKFRTDFDQELHRVIIHGVLHLLGYTDKHQKAKLIMRKKEDAYLSLR